MSERKRILLVLLIVAVAAVAAQAKDNVIAGVLTKVDQGRIEMTADDKKAVSLTLSSNTKYRRWIMSKPWQQDPNAKWSDLKVGGRVRVEVSGDAATTVWIVR
jgi:hypothetical protein